jgi:hypothetical protein
MIYPEKEFASKEVTQIKPHINSTSNVWCERLQPGAAQNFAQCVLKENTVQRMKKERLYEKIKIHQMMEV